ncbi:WXG100 family type VII secretion target [Nonomuraea sp. M3C6]|uniref:WXG100 family type VII secretion target n=1 Tax=Nonomuraea marmarensis TaxID=3351344 RepID=A0ABW7AB07_9ACTN
MSDRYLDAINKGRGVRPRDPYLDAINRGTSVRPPRTPSVPLNPATGRMGPMPAASEGSISGKVLESLKRLARLSPYLIPVAAIAAMAVADEVGMAQAASVWKFGMGARLDDGVKNLMPQILATSKSGWIAQDQEEFARVQAAFHAEIGVLRNTFNEIGGVVDEVAAGFRNYWLQLGSTVVSATTLLIGVIRMKFSPVPMVSAAGMILEHLVGTMMVSIVTVFTGLLGSMLKNGVDVLGTLFKKAHQFGFVLPPGAAAIDFGRATIHTANFPSFQEPHARGQLPAGYQKFDWVAPDVQTTTP